MADYSSNSILVPKIQEINSYDLFDCSLNVRENQIINVDEEFLCEKSLVKDINQELFKDFINLFIFQQLLCYVVF